MKVTDFRAYLNSVLEDSTDEKGATFDYIIQGLILLSIVSFSISTLPDLDSQIYEVLDVVERITVVIFSMEYVLRIFAAKNRLKYAFSFYGIIDLLAIAPFYFNWFFDLRFIRVFRLLRLFRVLKLLRYHKAINRFHVAFRYVKEEIILFLIISVILIFVTSAGIYFFEHEAQPEIFKSVFHSTWWAMVTLTTVGYGDVYPITVGGKIFTFFVLMIGIGFITVPAGLVATALTKARKDEELEEQNKA